MLNSTCSDSGSHTFARIGLPEARRITSCADAPTTSTPKIARRVPTRMRMVRVYDVLPETLPAVVRVSWQHESGDADAPEQVHRTVVARESSNSLPDRG